MERVFQLSQKNLKKKKKTPFPQLAITKQKNQKKNQKTKQNKKTPFI